MENQCAKYKEILALGNLHDKQHMKTINTRQTLVL